MAYLRSGALKVIPAATGSVLQTATGTITGAYTTTNTSYVSTGLTCNFDTLSLNSKVFVAAYWIGQSSAAATHVGGEWLIDRNGTDITHPAGDGFYFSITSSETWNVSIYGNLQVLDSPAVAAGTTMTYTLHAASRASAPTLRTGHNGSDCFITIFEIKA